MTSRHKRDQDRRDDAHRAIDRVSAESETIAGSTLARMAKRAQDHLGAADADSNDQVEVWGTRIGRIAGVVFAVGLLIYLFVTYL